MPMSHHLSCPVTVSTGTPVMTSTLPTGPGRPGLLLCLAVLLLVAQGETKPARLSLVWSSFTIHHTSPYQDSQSGIAPTYHSFSTCCCILGIWPKQGCSSIASKAQSLSPNFKVCSSHLVGTDAQACGLNAYAAGGKCVCYPPNELLADGVNCCRRNAELVQGACACKPGFTWSQATQACAPTGGWFDQGSSMQL